MKRCRLKRCNFQIKNDMNKENETSDKHKNGNDFIADVMPRFFIDERAGCIAIRDREHPKFDKDHKGLEAYLPDVVAFEMGKQVKLGKFISWDLEPKIIKAFKNRCDILNGA
jgi:hypothetical protein